MAKSRIAEPWVFNGDVLFTGAATFQGTVALPAGSVNNAAVAANAGIARDKLTHQQTIDRQFFAPGTTVAALTQLLKIVRGAAGLVVAFEAAVTAAPTGDYEITVDLQRSTAGGAFASILTAPIEFSVAEASVARVAQTATLSGTALVDGDLLQVVVAVSGTTGAQGSGLVVSLTQAETPE